MSQPKFPERFRTLLILGAPGSGKGTQGKVLGSIPRFHHLACGDVFRSIDTRTPIGQKFVEYSSRGELVPDDVTVELWRNNIVQRVESHQFKPEIDFLVLDGIPRNVEQAKYMEEDIEVLKVFHLSCPDPYRTGPPPAQTRPEGQPPGRCQRDRHPAALCHLRGRDEADPGLLCGRPHCGHRCQPGPCQGAL